MTTRKNSVHHEESERRIKKSFKRKGWSEVKANDSWAIFKIMSEFVEGFEAMQRIRPCVSIFGSARTKPERLNTNWPRRSRSNSPATATA
jgi:hypothetical protein